jgi:hypothetical protein
MHTGIVHQSLHRIAVDQGGLQGPVRLQSTISNLHPTLFTKILRSANIPTDHRFTMAESAVLHPFPAKLNPTPN